MSGHEDRLIELEIKYAHQERTVEQLEKVCFEQHRAIEELQKSFKQLNDRFEALMGPEVGPSDQKPPHY